MASLFPNHLADLSKRQIASCVYFNSPSVRDEAANFILAVCSEFDDVTSLLPIEKVPTSKAVKGEDGEGERPEEDMEVNFYSEPHKSKK